MEEGRNKGTKEEWRERRNEIGKEERNKERKTETKEENMCLNIPLLTHVFMYIKHTGYSLVWREGVGRLES